MGLHILLITIIMNDSCYYVGNVMATLLYISGGNVKQTIPMC